MDGGGRVAGVNVLGWFGIISSMASETNGVVA